ncbi:MAG: amino acid adenylation domain-containing protein, partial [Rhodothermales bacterium]|nr:amino acid adenylation domain-containing protein [Rhodothermales bacterium]
NYIFFLNQHQAFTDKNSARDFFKYLDRAYNCQQPGATEQDTRAQSSSYAEFLLDEDLYSKSTKAREGNQFWAQKYATPPVDFRPYGQRHARNSPLNDCHDVKLDSAIAEKIGSLTEKVPASNLFLLIAFAFLRKVTGSHDLCIDVPIDNRRPDYSGTLGCFIEPSPIRLAADLNDSFDELYSKMQDEIRECMQHCRQVITDSKLPHELLVDFRVIEDLKFVGFPAKLRQKRALTILNESFEGPRSAKHWGGLHSLVIDIAHLPTTNEYRISFEFNRGAWSEPGSQMQAIRHFLAILDAFLQDSSQTLTETGSLVEQGTHDEQFLRQMAIADVNEKRIPLIEHWRKQVPTHASRIALGQGNELLTHLQLSDRVESFAWGLTSLGVRRGDRVLVFSEASIQQTVAMLAVFSIGAVHVPVDPATPTERVSAIISNTDPVLVLVAEASHDLALPKKRKSSSLLSEVFCTPNRFGGATPSLSDPAYIIHTSGSSGAPKSVEISHGALASFSEAWSSAAEVDHSDRILQLSSPSFDASLAALVPALFEGAACILPDESWLQSPRELFNAIEKHGITIVKGPTAFFITIVYELEKGLPHPRGALRCWIMGGSEFPRDVVAKYSRLAPTEVALVNSYGPTETTVIVSSARLSSTETGPSGHVTIGKPLKTAGFRVVDGFGRELPLGVVGELWISGPQLATRYLGDEAKTQEKFPIDTAKTRWYRSGDLVRWRHDGQLEYFGRIDRQIQVRGFRVEPGEIETHLRKHEGVKNSYVSLMNLRGQD